MGWIDVHVHPPTKEVVIDSFGKYGREHLSYFKMDKLTVSIDEMLKEFDEANVEKLVLQGWDAETTTRLPKTPNDYIAKLVDQHPDRFIGFAGVDPHKGKEAVRELERAVKDLALKGLKLHPLVQKFFPNDEKFYPLWEKAQELKVPVLFHTGMAAWGAGLPGGDGFKLKYVNPIYLDDVAADFPSLTIIGAHPSWPWQEEMLAIAMHKPNVYMDLSGWSPKYFPPVLVQYMRGPLKGKFLFGTDYPFIKPRRWIDDFQRLDLSQEIKEKVLVKNATGVLNL
jgi:predicted TIM-barrel fold metal-dependent hydrolase